MVQGVTTVFGKGIVKLIARAGALVTTGYYRQARNALPTHAVGSVEIYGDAIFVGNIAQALSKLHKVYPYGYSLVQRYVRGVVQGESQRGKGIFLGVVYREWRRRNELPLPPERVAAQLVRHAVKMRKVLGFSIWRSPRSELANLHQELKAMKLLGCDPACFQNLNTEVLTIRYDRAARRLADRRRWKRISEELGIA